MVENKLEFKTLAIGVNNAKKVVFAFDYNAPDRVNINSYSAAKSDTLKTDQHVVSCIGYCKKIYDACGIEFVETPDASIKLWGDLIETDSKGVYLFNPCKAVINDSNGIAFNIEFENGRMLKKGRRAMLADSNGQPQSKMF